MKPLFVFDAAAWETPEARHAVETLASLLDMPWRIGMPGTAVGADDALVHVGRRDGVPAAATIAVEGWPRWEARTLVMTRVAGEPLACPPGTPDTEAAGNVFPPEWLRAAAHALHREEEFEDTRRDQWECYSGAYTRLGELGLLERPMLNHLAAALRARLEAHASSRGAMLESLPRWKGAKRFAVALTHDVDDVTQRSLTQSLRLLRQARGVRSYAFRAGLASFARGFIHPWESDSYWAFEHWMAEEERHGFNSRYYFCPPHPSPRHEYDALYTLRDVVGYEGRRVHVNELMRDMVRRGHEVGLHGSYMSHRDAGELSRQRTQIGDAIGGSPPGIRQHFLRFDPAVTWTAQAGAGFAYDTTLGYNEALGFRAGIAAPFRPWDPVGRKPHDLWELPLSVMDGALFRTLGLDADHATERVTGLLESVERSGGLAVLLWHPNAADERQFPGWLECYRRVLAWLAGREAWVTTAGELAAWWADRSRTQAGNPA